MQDEKTTYPEETPRRQDPLHAGASRMVRRRRVSLVRAALVAATISVALIFFVIWYRAVPHRLDCAKQAQRIAVAMESYVGKNGGFPAVLNALPVKSGRYSIEHFEYCFTGLGGPASIPDGTVIAYCVEPHRQLFGESWRNVLVYRTGRIILEWMPEHKFQKFLAQQRPPEQFYRQPDLNIELH